MKVGVEVSCDVFIDLASLLIFCVFIFFHRRSFLDTEMLRRVNVLRTIELTPFKMFS